MKKLLLIFVLVLALSACQGRAQTTEAPPGETAEASPVPAASVTAEEVVPASTAEEPAGAASGPASCTVVSVRPTPGPTEESLFPPVTDQDWTIGPADAAVTIIEYSDFQ
jgi:hypothetical protein